jgi:hypothetical protein
MRNYGVACGDEFLNIINFEFKHLFSGRRKADRNYRRRRYIQLRITHYELRIEL